jgi:acetylornithine deacetylase/succinyl-diaminopimelate desuccinylase-like protein
MHTPPIPSRAIWSGLLVLSLTAALSATATAQDGLAVSRAYRQAHAPAILREYAELLALPNVASDTENIARNARYLEEHLTALGVRTELLHLPGASPIVYGRLDVPGATRTLALYAHYDGQPVNPREWHYGPWTPTLLTALPDSGGIQRALPRDGETVDPEWRLYARSAGDDKAPIGALLTVLAAFRERHIRPTANIVFFFEGEEEAGSVHLGDYLRSYRDRLDDVDVWLFLDGPVHQSGRPLLAFGARGVTGLEVTVFGPTHGLHSGHYGNWAPVPGRLLAQLLATMWDADGHVLVPGFYDDVAPIGEAERAALARLPNEDAELRHELGLAHTEGEPATLAEQLMLPALTVLGLNSANVGALATNIIPATATATLGVRLVKGNDPETMLDLIEAHIRRQGYFIVRDDPDLSTRLAHPLIAKVRRDHGYPAARTDMNQPIVKEITAAATRASGGAVVLMPGMGGSLPLYLFTDLLGKPALVLPVANHDDNQHAPDENLRITNLWYAIDLFGALLTMPAVTP